MIALAKDVRGMIPFFSLLGYAIQNGRSRLAYRMLRGTGLSGTRAWSLVDNWERMIETETRTGWTAEVTAMGFVINDVEAWFEVQWAMLIGQFVTTAKQGRLDPLVKDSRRE